MKKVLYIILAMIFLSLLFFNYCLAQHFINLTDKAKIECGLNLIRKGVQKKDTTLVLSAIYPDLEVKGNTLSREILKNKLQSIFDNSSERKTTIKKPPFRGLTDLWDFDILDWKIDIQKDSAVVDCKLMFWGVKLDKSVSKTGAGKIEERLIFKKQDHFWGLKKASNLFLFLEKYGEVNSSELKNKVK